MKVPFFEEMKKVGLNKSEIIIFSLLGITFWSVLTWLFTERYIKIKDSDENSVQPQIKNLSIIILSFHIITIFFVFFETRYLNRILWLSWIIIALALSATFLNTIFVSRSLDEFFEPYENVNMGKEISTVVLQVFANSLMTAYIFKLIRSKGKMLY